MEASLLREGHSDKEVRGTSGWLVTGRRRWNLNFVPGKRDGMRSQGGARDGLARGSLQPRGVTQPEGGRRSSESRDLGCWGRKNPGNG